MKPSLYPRRWFLFALALLVPVLAGAQTAAPKRVLVVTVTTGFRHSSIPTAEKILAELAERSGKFTVDFVRQPPGQPRAPGRPRVGAGGENDPQYRAALQRYEEQRAVYDREFAQWLPSVAAVLAPLSPQNLQRYDAVVFANTTGDLPLPDKEGFLEWIRRGKGFVGVHSATDTFHGFPAFIEMIGGEFLTHGPQVEVECINQDPHHAACRHLPSRWTLFDEIYQFKNFERSRVHGLLGLDRHPNNKTPGDYPVAWSKSFGQGRVFYTSLGHREDIWDPQPPPELKRVNGPQIARAFQQHLSGGLLWALGLESGGTAEGR